MERGRLAYLLGVSPGTLRRLIWGLSRRNLLRAYGESVCITRLGEALASKVSVFARKRQKFVLLVPGLLFLVYVRQSGARATPIPLQAACAVCKALSDTSVGDATVHSIASRVGFAAKTVSYVVKALDVLGCPGPGCMLPCCR